MMVISNELLIAKHTSTRNDKKEEKLISDRLSDVYF